MEAEPLHKFPQLTLRARKEAQLENIGRFREGNVDVVPLGFRKGGPGPRRTQAIIKFPDFAVFQLDSTLGIRSKNGDRSLVANENKTRQHLTCPLPIYRGDVGRRRGVIR
jgi:hypothetical protein